MKWTLALLCLGACEFEGVVGVDPRGLDADGDGQTPRDGDCDDTEPTVGLDFQERCDGLDNDCDGKVDGAACAREDAFVCTSVVDLLLVVDNTESMREELQKIQGAVGDLIPHLVGGGRDIHIGVITSDLGTAATAGTLVDAAGSNYGTSDLSVADGVDWLLAATDVGTDGSSLEQARGAAYAALNDHPDNVGFRRPSADLAILILSDEDDLSAVPTIDDFMLWLDRGQGREHTTVHSIVSTEETDPCGSGAMGVDHLALTGLTHGTWLSICELDYGPFLSALGQIVVQQGLPRRFDLTRPADPATVRVYVSHGGGPVDILDAGRFYYDSGSGQLVITDNTPPAAGSVVRVAYQELP